MNLAELFRHETELHHLQAGENLFRAGDDGDLMYVLISGTAEIIVNGKVVERVEPGAMLGEMAMIDDSPRSATVTALTECKLVPIERKRFNFMIQQTPNFAQHVMRIMAARLRKTDSYL